MSRKETGCSEDLARREEGDAGGEARRAPRKISRTVSFQNFKSQNVKLVLVLVKVEVISTVSFQNFKFVFAA